MKINKKTYYCPRCGNKEIIDYSDSFDFLLCSLEFQKQDCEELEDAKILAVEEKLSIVKSLGLNNQNKLYLFYFFKSL